MKKIRFHVVYTKGNSHCSDSISSLPPRDNSVLFYVREEVNHDYSYGSFSNFIIIDRDGNASEYVFNEDKRLKGFNTSGSAKEYILTLEIQNALDNLQSIRLVADAQFNLPDSALYNYSEWDHENIFTSIITYFEEIKKYGEVGYKMIQNLKKDCWDKDNCIHRLKRCNDRLTEQLQYTREKIKDTLEVLKQISD